MVKKSIKTLVFTAALTATLAMGLSGIANAGEKKEKEKWLAGDFYQHTYYTDGSTTFDFVMGKNNEFGLDWWANSEHGGSRNRDGEGNYWDTYPVNPILGDVVSSGGHQIMWRWQSLRDFVYPDILEARTTYPEKQFFPDLNGMSLLMSTAV